MAGSLDGLFGKTKRVQRGYAAGSAGPITIDAVDMENAQLTISGTSGFRLQGGSGGGVVGGRLTSSTTITISQGNIDGNSTIYYGNAYWEVSDYV
jgi:hypothetical protein